MAEPAVRAQPGVARAQASTPGSHPGKHSELPKGQPLFDSLFVFENAPVKSRCWTALRPERQFRLRAYPPQLPLTVVCYPGDDLGLHLSYDQRYFEAPTVERLLGEFSACLLLALADGFPANWRPCRCSARTSVTLLDGCNRSAATTRWSKATCGCSRAQVAALPQRIRRQLPGNSAGASPPS
ncbi:hypothetical protein P4118_21450 [Pseudomonas aeruginosa]|nr:hypothetical protein [Pseudomonas aeruginosa]